MRFTQLLLWLPLSQNKYCDMPARLLDIFIHDNQIAWTKYLASPNTSGYCWETDYGEYLFYVGIVFTA